MIVSQYNNRKQWYFENIISKNYENGNYCVSMETPFHFETLLSLYTLLYTSELLEKKIYFHNMKQRYET